MKYTVLIRQPVPDEIRPQLEEQLVARFGLSAEQAQRLAARRSGRLMKPTAQARAELLVEVFESVGARVSLEEVRADAPGPTANGPVANGPVATVLTANGPAVSVAAATPSPDLTSAEQLLNGQFIPEQPTAGQPDPFASAGASDPFMPSSDLFADLFAAPVTLDPITPSPVTPSPVTPSPVKPSPVKPNPVALSPVFANSVLGKTSGALAAADSESSGPTSFSPDSAEFGFPGLNGPDLSPALGAAESGPDILPDWACSSLSPAQKEASPAREGQKQGFEDRERLGRSAAAGESAGGGHSAGSAKDDWADFTGSLSLTEPDTLQTSRPVGAAPRQTTEFLTDVGEEAASGQPRHSLTQQIRLATLLPLGLSGLLTLGLLLLALPRLEQRLVQSSAQTLASVIGTTLPGGAAAQAEQLSRVVRDPSVGFVRVEANGGATLRASATSDLAALNARLTAWSGSARPAPQLRVGRQNYGVSRVSIVRGSGGALQAVAAGQERSAPVVRRVTVGVAGAQAAANLRSTLGLVLLATLLGLLLALAFAARAARQIVGPLERLVEVADAISLGDLTRPVRMERHDEIGDLAQALERMRLSLEAAMDRLRRRKRT